MAGEKVKWDEKFEFPKEKLCELNETKSLNFQRKRKEEKMKFNWREIWRRIIEEKFEEVWITIYEHHLLGVTSPLNYWLMSSDSQIMDAH